MEVSRTLVSLVILVSCCMIDTCGTAASDKSIDDNDAVSCPDAADIFPCTCFIDVQLNMDLNCSGIEDEEELAKVMASNFPFPNFRRLTIINYGSLKMLKAGVLGKTTYQEFTISVDSLEVVEGGALSGSFDTAAIMDFSYCNIVSFPFEELPMYTSLHTLNLQHCSIRSFPNLKSGSLQKLYLIGNLMGPLPVAAFNNTPSLQIIFLTNTGIRDLSPGIFANLPDLWIVHLGVNELKHIEEGSFQMSGYRRSYVLLHRNNISSVAPNAITGLTGGGGVGLWRNNMTVLDEEVWRPLLIQGVELDLTENPLLCGCDVAWIVLNPTFKDHIGEDTTCSDGQYFADLEPVLFEDC